jgi:hypothetical protein
MDRRPPDLPQIANLYHDLADLLDACWKAYYGTGLDLQDSQRLIENEIDRLVRPPNGQGASRATIK